MPGIKEDEGEKLIITKVKLKIFRRDLLVFTSDAKETQLIIIIYYASLFKNEVFYAYSFDSLLPPLTSHPHF